MDTDCLQEEISVAPEQTVASNVSTISSIHPDDDDDSKAQQHSHHSEDVKVGSCDGSPISVSPSSPRMEASEHSSDKVTNGDNAGKSTDWEEEDNNEFEASSEVTLLKDGGLSQSFKSSYAKSLADSYRRASIPVVVSSPKGQFYFENDELLSLSANQVRRTDSSSSDKFYSLKTNGNKSVLVQNADPQSLPLFSQEKQEKTEKSKEKLDLISPHTSICERLLDDDVFVPYDQLQQVCKEHGASVSLQDWHNLGSIITSDGRKLIRLSDLKVILKQKEQHNGKTQNGHVLVNGSEKDSQVESLLVERGQLGGRVEQLCQVLADRDATIQRLEEDLLRIRMECQRLMVDNRSLKSSLGQGSNNQQSSQGIDATSQVTHLQQQVQLLTAQLTKAEQSRHTYEAATRQLVEFLHTVNSTLNSANYLYPSASPTCSHHSSTSNTTTRTSSSTHAEGEVEDDPPYRLTTHPNTPPTSRFTSGPVRSNSEAMRKAGSVWALPTHTSHPRKVSRAASTHCVASAASGYQGDSAVPAAASQGVERTRPHTTEFLASRARELLASLRSLIRSDSVMKLNLEPKKSGTSINSGRGRYSGRGTKPIDSSSMVSPVDPETSQTQTQTPARLSTTTTTGEPKRPISLPLPASLIEREKERRVVTQDQPNASPTAVQNTCTAPVNATPAATNSSVAPVPRISTGETREGTLQPQSSMGINSNPQPLSLMVVGEHSCTHEDHHFSSLPLRTRISRTLNDSDHRLVWV